MDATLRMRDRFLQQEVWERLGVDFGQALPFFLSLSERQLVQKLLFTKIVPNCKKLGLLDANGGWLRERFTRLGIIDYEHVADADAVDL